jgi:hypothetical protein
MKQHSHDIVGHDGNIIPENTMQTPQGSAAPAAAPEAPAIPQVPALPVTGGPTAAWEAARAARNELRNQLDRLVDQRHDLLRELEDHDVAGPATSGMQARIQGLDARIAQLDIAVAQADANVATAAAVPGAVVEPPRPFRDGPPEEVFFMVPPLLALIFLPMAIAMARRIWKRTTGQVPASLPSDLAERLNRLEAMGETTALEVERIGEGQRFVTRLLTEREAPLLGDAERIGFRNK